MTRIAELEAKGKQDSGNSSKPPSSDLGRKRKPPVEPSGRKRGGQPGHAGQNRELAPPEEVDEVVDQDPLVQSRCEGKSWLEGHSRVHVHFTPTRASWLNMVERFFRDITENRIRRGIFRSVPELEAAIHTYIARHNGVPKPFIWTASSGTPRPPRSFQMPTSPN